ncbi:hypothetical protein [Achromobacter ruhlandii]|uniref:hypothetical protein n=1 Tax=Achromobacter ruhlandii TaxID=72557 RepID=UPI0007BF7BB7|nr:hypothetical protein [Achromobacter ruhlandii]
MKISFTASQLCTAAFLAIYATMPTSATATPAGAPQSQGASTAITAKTPSHLAIVLERPAPATGKGVEPKKPIRVDLAVPTDGSDTPFRDLTTADSPLETDCPPDSQDLPPKTALELGLGLSVIVVDAGHSGAILQIQGRESSMVGMDSLQVSKDCQWKIPRVSTDNFAATIHLPLDGTPVQLNKAWSARATAL